MTESSGPRGGYPGPIAQMAPWFFWTRTCMLGVSAEESDALDRGETLPPARFAALRARLEDERAALANAPANAARI